MLDPQYVNDAAQLVLHHIARRYPLACMHCEMPYDDGAAMYVVPCGIRSSDTTTNHTVGGVLLTMCAACLAEQGDKQVATEFLAKFADAHIDIRTYDTQ